MTSNRNIILLLLVAFLVLLSSCAQANRKIAARKGFNRDIQMQSFFTVEAMEIGETFDGVASYYGPGFHGKRTASGEVYNQNANTCAHKTLPFGTKLKVTLLSSGKSTIVRVNDRGPYIDDRVIDLSVASAKQIGLYAKGVEEVLAEVVP